MALDNNLIVILKVGANAGEVRNEVNSMLLELISGADAAQF